MKNNIIAMIDFKIYWKDTIQPKEIKEVTRKFLFDIGWLKSVDETVETYGVLFTFAFLQDRSIEIKIDDKQEKACPNIDWAEELLEALQTDSNVKEVSIFMNEESKGLILNKMLDAPYNVDEENQNRYFVVYHS